MKRKIITIIVLFAVIPIIFVGIRRKLSVKPIVSQIAQHMELDIEVVFKNSQLKDHYISLTEGQVVSGEIEVMIQNTPENEDYTYIEYKVNGFNHSPGYLPSYSTTIDTSLLPNGWNQLLVVGYKNGEKLEGVKQVFFKVDNSRQIRSRIARQNREYELGQVPSYKRNYIPVLMYHDFREIITKEQESAVVSPALFEEHLKILIKNEYTPVTFKDLDLYIKGEAGLPAKPFIITADDGYLSNYEKAFPILKKYNVPATFFVTSRYVGVDTSSAHFTWEQAKEMEESGLIDIQSHTHSHLLLSTLPDDEIRHQVGISFGLIEENLGKRDVKVLAYPQFYCNQHTKEILKEEGVDLQITNLGKWYKASTEPTSIQRIHVANDTTPEDLIREIERLTR